MSKDSRSDLYSRLTANPYFLVIILTLATFMEIVDLSVLSVTLPKMTSDLAASPNEIVLVISSYLIANAAIIPITGWLATYFGRKRYYLACVVGFTVSSLFCGLAPNLEILVFFRILQGVSGGGLAVSEQAILASITEPAKLGRVFSIYGSGLMFASVIAPTMGGYITDSLGWRWIFFINIPIGIAAFFLTSIFVNDPGDKKKAKDEEIGNEAAKIDWIGIFLIIVGVSTLFIVLESGPQESWFDSSRIFVLTMIAGIALVFAFAWEMFTEHPVFDLTLFKSKSFAAAATIIFVASAVFSSGIAFVMAFFTQNVLDYSAMDTGLLALPGAISVMIGVQIVGYLVDRFEAKYLIAFGYLVATIAIFNLANLTTYIPFALLALNRTLSSLSLSFGAVGVNATAYYGLKPEKHNAASSILNLARVLGASTGYSIVGSLFVVYSQKYFSSLSAGYSVYNQNFVEAQRALADSLIVKGVSADTAGQIANSALVSRLFREAYTLASIDLLHLFAYSMIVLFLLSFLLKKKPKSKVSKG